MLIYLGIALHGHLCSVWGGVPKNKDSQKVRKKEKEKERKREREIKKGGKIKKEKERHREGEYQIKSGFVEWEIC